MRSGAPVAAYTEPIAQTPPPSDATSALAERLNELLRRQELAAGRLRTAAARRLGMSETEGLAIAQLSVHGELGQARLGDLLDLSPGGTAALVQRLEQEGRVVRRQAAHDRRLRMISLSPAMAARVALFEGTLVAELEGALGAMTSGHDEVLALLDAFARATEARADAAGNVAGRSPSPADRLTPSLWG